MTINTTANSVHRGQRGFSLVEILVVLVIMGLLISVVAPTVLNRADEARVQKVHADLEVDIGDLFRGFQACEFEQCAEWRAVGQTRLEQLVPLGKER